MIYEIQIQYQDTPEAGNSVIGQTRQHARGKYSGRAEDSAENVEHQHPNEQWHTLAFVSAVAFALASSQMTTQRGDPHYCCTDHDVRRRKHQ